MMVWPLASEEPDIPVLMYHELDGDRMERRKVLVFRDGSLAASSDTVDVGGYELGSEATPPMEEIRADPQFHPHLISRNDFEWAWAKATGALSPASDPCRSADESLSAVDTGACSPWTGSPLPPKAYLTNPATREAMTAAANWRRAMVGSSTMPANGDIVPLVEPTMGAVHGTGRARPRRLNQPLVNVA